MSKKFKVTFYPDNKIIEVDEGENLLRAAMAAEVYINASCGGSGTCGKCRVIIDKGKIERQTAPRPELTKEKVDEGYALACLSTIASDLEVRIPLESRLGERKPAERRAVPTCGHLLSSSAWVKRLPPFKLNPCFRKVYLELPPPSLNDTVSDERRIKRELKKAITVGRLTIAHRSTHALDAEEIEFGYPVLKYLAETVRKKDWKVTVTLFQTESKIKIIDVEPGDTTAHHYAIAVDLGTTSVAAELLDLNSGEIIAEASDYNAQISCGDDVISRIVYANKPGGLEKLQELSVETINRLAGSMIEEKQIDPNQVDGFFIAGNTIMLHLLLGLTPKYIREEPYIPTTGFSHWIRATDAGIELSRDAFLYCLPSVASYVGGDITAGVLSSGLWQTDKLTLYIDIGTNGELVLGNSDWLISCACSAGPAFEGGGVKHGMRAVKGAIEQVRIDRETYEPMLLTIGQVKPIGICGSGMIDVLAELFLAGAIDQKGQFNLEVDSSRIRRNETHAEYVLVWAEDSATKEDIVITEVDIDNLLRAKAAVYAGITMLMESVGVIADQLEEVLIAGAFGNYLEVEKLITIGMLPDIPCDKFTFVGNGSLHGAHLVALSCEMKAKADEIAEKMTYLELSANPKFMDRYVSALFLPHTNLGLFPSVAKQMKSSRENQKVKQQGSRRGSLSNSS